MVDFNRINPSILKEVEALAAARNQPADVLVEDALRAYLGGRASPDARVVGAGGEVSLPVARHLARPMVDLSRSLGNLLEVEDEGLPLEKLR